MRIFVIGTPLISGGANVEAGHTILAWRRLGIDVTIIRVYGCTCRRLTPGWGRKSPWRPLMEAAGVDIAEVSCGHFNDVHGLAGSIVVDFQHSHAIHNAAELRSLG